MRKLLLIVGLFLAENCYSTEVIICSDTATGYDCQTITQDCPIEDAEDVHIWEGDGASKSEDNAILWFPTSD